MSRFGIGDYEPRWLNGRRSVLAVHGERLAALAGRTLRHVWGVWDLADDEWFVDAPVVLDFDGERLAVDHQKSDDLSLTWNAPDPTRVIEDDWFRLAWRAEPFPELAHLVGRTLNRVELMEWHQYGRVMTVSVGFDLTPAWLTVENAGDENGFSYTVPDRGWRRYPVSSTP
jgi:hypothetical protein